MKKALTILATTIFAGVCATAAFAQISSTEITNFNHYLDNHPEVAQRLAANPQLANDPQFPATIAPGSLESPGCQPGAASVSGTMNREDTTWSAAAHCRGADCG